MLATGIKIDLQENGTGFFHLIGGLSAN